MALNAQQQHLQVYSGNQAGQTAGDSFAGVSVSGGVNVTVQATLQQTNQLNATLRLWYTLDGGAAVDTGQYLTTDSGGNGSASFTIRLTSGSHSISVLVNSTPVPGTTYYVTASPIPFTTSQEQMVVYSGNPRGQTLDGSSIAGISPAGGNNVSVTVSLVWTNQPNTTFQLYYSLDGGAPVATGVTFTTDASGNGSATFTLQAPKGYNGLGIDVNSTPGAGTTYYVTTTPIPFIV